VGSSIPILAAAALTSFGVALVGAALLNVVHIVAARRVAPAGR